MDRLLKIPASVVLSILDKDKKPITYTFGVYLKEFIFAHVKWRSDVEWLIAGVSLQKKLPPDVAEGVEVELTGGEQEKLFEVARICEYPQLVSSDVLPFVLAIGLAAPKT